MEANVKSLLGVWSSGSYLGTSWTKAKSTSCQFITGFENVEIPVSCDSSSPKLAKPQETESEEVCPQSFVYPFWFFRASLVPGERRGTLALGLVSSTRRTAAQSRVCSFLLRKRKSSMGDYSPDDISLRHDHLLWVLRWTFHFLQVFRDGIRRSLSWKGWGHIGPTQRQSAFIGNNERELSLSSLGQGLSHWPWSLLVQQTWAAGSGDFSIFSSPALRS